MKLEVSLFRFDHKSDYLPYYTKNYIKVKNQKNLLDLLNTINVEHPFGYENSLDFCVSVNGIYLSVDISVDELVKNFGKDLTIEPLSIRRSYTDLLINEDDFNQRLELLSPFISEGDKAIYQSYKIYFYASNTINYEYDYIGDALLLLASDLIKKDNSKEQEILEVIKDYECSVQFHTNLTNRIYNFDSAAEEKIALIKTKLNISKEIKEQEFVIDKKATMNFGNFDEDKEIKYDFNEFNIAYYKGLKEDTQMKNLLSRLKAKVIDTQNMSSDLALDTFHLNSNFTIKLASEIMLDAFDKSADLLVVDNDNIFNLFDANRKSLEKVSGRSVIIPVIHKNELAKLAFGMHEEVKESLSKHSINPEII